MTAVTDCPLKRIKIKINIKRNDSCHRMSLEKNKNKKKTASEMTAVTDCTQKRIKIKTASDITAVTDCTGT